MASTLSLSAAFWVPILTGGFPAEGKLLAIQLAKVELVGMALIGSAVVARTAYHARGEFVWPAWAAVISASAGLTYLVWRLPRDGVVAAAWSYTLRSVLECLLLLPGLGRAVKPNFRSPFQFEAWRRVRPLLLGYSYERSEMVLDRFLASMAPAGGLSLLYLGQQVWGAAGQIMNRAVALPITPTLARLAGRGEWAGFRQLYQSRLGQVFAICAVAVALLALVGRPSLDLVFGIRNMSEEDVRVLWLLMLLLFGLLIGDPSGHLLLTSFYAKGDTLTPTRIGIVAYSFGIGCKLLGFFSFGLPGLAAGTTIFYLARSWALWSTLNRSTPTRV
jgi:putative peptidoglycan lipid II flippase